MAEANNGLLEVEISKEDQDTKEAIKAESEEDEDAIEEIKIESEEDEDDKEVIKVEIDEEDEDVKERIKDLQAQIEKISAEYLLQNFGKNKPTLSAEENGTGFKRRNVRGGRWVKAKKKWTGISQTRRIMEMIMKMNVESLRKGLKPSFSLSKNLSKSQLSEKTKNRSKKNQTNLFTMEILRRQQVFLRMITKMLSEKVVDVLPSFQETLLQFRPWPSEESSD